MNKLEQAFDYIREATGMANKEEKKINWLGIIIAIAAVAAVIGVIVFVLCKFLNKEEEFDIDDFDDPFYDNDDFFEDEEDIVIKPQVKEDGTEKSEGKEE